MASLRNSPARGSVLVVFSLFWALFPVQAQNFKPFTSLRVIQTAHFNIIYPKESEGTAQTLFLRAEAVYERVSGLLGIGLDRRLPVVITPHTDKFNGYMNPMPYFHIVLFDTPMDPELTIFQNSLETLFLHELTHAVSLNSRGPFLKGLRSVFGGWVYPVALTAPLFMVEGAAVSFESLDGYGRANDPLIKEQLSQAVYEGTFFSPFQASGVYDLSPASSAYYEYGGLFSAYLQEKYGMEKYAELWQAMGRRYYFSFFFYNYGYFHIFKDVYGIPFLEAWENFKESLRIRGIEENPHSILPAGGKEEHAFGGGPQVLIDGMSSGGGRVFILDRISQGVLSFDPLSGKTRRVVSTDNTAYGLAASPDGGRLLVSSYRYSGALARAVVTEYDISGEGKPGRIWEGLYSGRYFRDGVIGLASEGHANALVFRSPQGEEVLLRGNDELLYSSPAALDDTRIIFIAARGGIRELCLYNYENGKAYTLSSDLEDDGERWRYIRSLQVSEGRVLFGFNHDGRMYKLGAAVPSSGGNSGSMEAVFTERDFSGGVFLPVSAQGAVYYRGAFASQDVLMRYPEPGNALSGVRTILSPKPWEEEQAGTYAGPAPGERPDPGPKSRRYSSLAYLNPLKFWLPIPLLRSTRNGPSLDGGGIFSFMGDPIGANQIFLTAAMDARALMAYIDLRWTNRSLGFPLLAAFTDDIDKTQSRDFRRTEAAVSASFSGGLGHEGRQISFKPGFTFTLFADDPGDGSNVYTWPYGDPYYTLSLGAGFSTLRRFDWELFGRGVSLEGYGRFQVREPAVRFDGLLRTAFEPFPLRSTLYWAWDEGGMNIHGKSRLYGSVPFSAVAAEEYPGSGFSQLRWLGGGEAEVKLFSYHIQKNLSHLYFNRIYGTLAYRGALYDDGGIRAPQGNPLGGDYRLTQSLVLRFGSVISTILITVMPIRIQPYLWGAWKISNMNDGKMNDFIFGFNFSIEM
jgi:hypothetical protein